MCVDIFNNIAKLYILNGKNNPYMNLSKLARHAYNRKISTCSMLAEMIRGDNSFQTLIVDQKGEEDSFVVKISADTILSWHMVKNNISTIDWPKLEHIDSVTAKERFGNMLGKQNRQVFKECFESRQVKKDTLEVSFTGGGSYEEKQPIPQKEDEKVADSKEIDKKDASKNGQKMLKRQEEVQEEMADINRSNTTEITKKQQNYKKRIEYIFKNGYEKCPSGYKKVPTKKLSELIPKYLTGENVFNDILEQIISTSENLTNEDIKHIKGYIEERKLNKYLIWSKACEERIKQLSLDGKPELKEDSSNFNPKTRLSAKDVFKWVKEQNLSNEETLELVKELLDELKNKDERKVRNSDKSDGRG